MATSKEGLLLFLIRRNWVEAEYGPFESNEDLDQFIEERDEELQLAFDEWCREDDSIESLEGEEA